MVNPEIHHERVPGGDTVVEHATAQPPDHQGHGFLWLPYQFRLYRSVLSDDIFFRSGTLIPSATSGVLLLTTCREA